MITRNLSLAVVGCAVALAGCTAHESASPTASSPADGAYRLASEPEGAIGVGQARRSAVDQQEVVLVGRIGGSARPFVDGLAAFTLVDPAVPHCTAEEGCETPWDYCCHQNQVRENIATVTIVDEEGQPVTGNARQLLGVKELQTVVVRGTAQRSGDGNLTLAAHKVYVRP